MGLSIYIGNAVLDKLEDLDTGSNELPSWVVEEALSLDAPVFPNDPSFNSNGRWPTYSVWFGFITSVGLSSLFYDESTGLMRKDSGVIRLSEGDYSTIAAALVRWNVAHPNTVPGFEKSGMPDTGMDATKARLMWLCFWVRWALDNCKLPAIWHG